MIALAGVDLRTIMDWEVHLNSSRVFKIITLLYMTINAILVFMKSRYHVIPICWLFAANSLCAGIQIPTTSNQYHIFLTAHQCWPYESPFHPATIHILYDVNPSEGFNLRRDVYLRLAVFLRTVQSRPGWSKAKLVLPPFRNLYHWQSSASRSDVSFFWNHFFDLDSLSGYTDVLDMWQFLAEAEAHLQVVQLKGFTNMFENGVFVEKFELAKRPERRTSVSVMGYRNLSQLAVGRFWPCRLQGSVMQLQPMLEMLWERSGRPKEYRVFLRNAEVVLHDGFGDAEFWRARRSMRFAKTLVEVAEEFRRNVMGERGDLDEVQRPPRWQDEKVSNLSLILINVVMISSS